MRRLRALTEAECYARCYGEFEGSVRVLEPEPRLRSGWSAVTGEDLRRRFEQLLDDRGPEPEAEAA